MTPPVVWLLLGLIALIIEAISLNLVFVFVAVAALFAGCMAAVGVPILGQIASFIVAGLVLPMMLRPRLLARMGGRGVMSRTDALFGETAQVTAAIDPVLGTGRVVANGHDWAARSTDPLSVGTLVMIEGADGIVLLVSPLTPPGERLRA
jgi:membrane protein implicated in regulation of membrane protease activity